MENNAQQELPDVRIFAWDYSGSTSSMAYYHTTGKTHLDKFEKLAKRTPHIPVHYLIWEWGCKKIEVAELREIIQNKGGSGGTDPSSIVSWIMAEIPSSARVHLCLITDGEIGQGEMRRCAEANVNVNYEKVDFVVINQRQTNMSVGAAFVSNSRVEIYKNAELFKQVNTSAPFNYDSITIQNFSAEIDVLIDFIQTKFMGSNVHSLQEVEKLVALKGRLLKELSAKEASSNGAIPRHDWSVTDSEGLLKELRSCEFYQALTSPQIRNERQTIDSSICSLINYIHNDNKSYDFESVKVDFRMGNMSSAAEDGEVELELDLGDLKECKQVNFYDAVSLEEEANVPVLLLEVHDLIDKCWIGKSYSQFRALMDCPLKAKVDGCIGHVFSYESFVQLMDASKDDGRMINPMTNNVVHGGLVFSPKADEYNDYVLYMSLFQGKKVKTCLSLWYYVIWKSAQTKPWIEEDVKDLLQEYAFRRLDSARVKLGFSTLPLEPKEVVPIPVACFFCTEGSSRLFGQDPVLYPYEKLRMFWSVSDSMVDIMQHYGYSGISAEFIKERAKTFGVMGQLKHIPVQNDKVYFLLSKIFESVGPILTRKIRNWPLRRYLHLLKYDHKQSVIPFEYKFGFEETMKLVLVSYEGESANVPLCPQTLRPYFSVKNEHGKYVPYYEEVIKTVRNTKLVDLELIPDTAGPTNLDQTKLISPFKQFIDVTAAAQSFPTLQELTDYVHKAKKFSGRRVRLFPDNIHELISQAFGQYEQMRAELSVDVKSFMEITRSSVNTRDRFTTENQMFKISKVSANSEFVENAKKILFTHNY